MTHPSASSFIVEPTDLVPATFRVRPHSGRDQHLAPANKVWLYTPHTALPERPEVAVGELVAHTHLFHRSHSPRTSDLAFFWRRRWPVYFYTCRAEFLSEATPPSIYVKILTKLWDSRPAVSVPSLAGKYTVDDSAVNFLQHHRFLLPLLLEAYEPIRTHFPDAQLFLEVATDPESMAAPELVLSIAPTCPPEEAVDRFLELMETWWATVEDRAHDQLSIILKYR